MPYEAPLPVVRTRTYSHPINESVHFGSLGYSASCGLPPSHVQADPLIFLNGITQFAEGIVTTRAHQVPAVWNSLGRGFVGRRRGDLNMRSCRTKFRRGEQQKLRISLLCSFIRLSGAVARARRRDCVGFRKYGDG